MVQREKMSNLQQAITLMEDIQNDPTVSEKVKKRIKNMKQELQETKEDKISLKINKILADLEDISNDVNIPAFVRTQIWHMTSILESAQ